MTALIWITLLLLLACAFIVVELFVPVPTGGLMGFLAVVAMLAAVGLGFLQGPVAGFATLLITVVGIPLFLSLSLKIFPKTSMGRRVLLSPPKSEDVLPDAIRSRALEQHVGQLGRAKSKMLPGGIVEIDGRSFNALTEGMPLEAGQWVRVLRVEGTSLVVRPAETAELPPALSGDEPPDERSRLQQPVDRIAPDPFQDPLV